MIRRGFWLVAGAAIGVTGYRKVTRLGRTLTGQQGVAQLSPTPARRQISATTAGADRGATTTPWPVRLAAGTRSAAGFIRDVRDGMADYRARNAEDAAARLAGQAGAGQHSADNSSWPDDEDTLDYHGLRGEQLGRSLGSQRDRARPGLSQQGPREP
jgi:hypothetical protein